MDIKKIINEVEEKVSEEKIAAIKVALSIQYKNVVKALKIYENEKKIYENMKAEIAEEMEG